MAGDKERLKFVVGVSSGIYMAARSPELSSVVRKLGFALTRGANAIELAADVPHEIDYTQGKELRYIAEKQDLTLLLHGSLTVPMCMPERGEWRDAQNHIQKSVRSAVMGGCKYVNFHACLHYWLEMMTYAGRKLTMAFCNHEGKFISIIFEGDENRQARKWFIERHWTQWARAILTDEELRAVESPTNVERDMETQKEERDLLDRARNEGWFQDQERVNKERTEIAKMISERMNKKNEDSYKKAIDEKLKGGKVWDREELSISVIDGYHMMAHHLYYKNDPIWQTMYEMYRDVIDKKYKTVKYHRNNKDYTYSPGHNDSDSNEVDYWVDAAWEQAERNNDREFKEFYYSVCAAKFIEGHTKATLEWMKDEGPEGLIGGMKAGVKDDEDFKKLKKIAEELKITLEIPDARSAEYAGLYLICRPKQIYAAVKTIREQIGTDRLFMLIDFEHIATQGFDAFNEIQYFVKLAPDAGKYILSLHVTKPTPLHHHIQVEIGDIDIYRLLWELTKVGLGEHHTTYLIYERGGERDPFKQSVTAIRLMVDQLQKNTKPEELVAKPEFFGVAGPALGSEERQRVVIREHARDPLEGLLVVPEEKYTALGKAATEKAGAEKWKKEELA